MNGPIHFSYDFHPVGQGLFASGSIRKEHQTSWLFSWVYDCGSSFGKRFVERELKRLADANTPQKRIDLLTLSHFDHDHISGVCDLLRQFAIDTLLLPFMPLGQRLQIAFEEGIDPGDALAGFFVNPVAFLLAIEGAEIRRILFVPPSGNEGPPPIEGEPSAPDEPDQPGDEPKLDFERGKPDDPREHNELSQSSGSTLVEWLRPGARIALRSFWEFVPYNDDAPAAPPSEWLSAIDNERTDLLSETSTDVRKEILSRLVDLYDSLFGRRSEQRNVISLFLYTGPIYPTWRVAILDPLSEPILKRIADHPFVAHPAFSSKVPCSVLYSGDGYLDRRERLDRLITFLNPGRIANVAAFQVMHHGAAGNWHDGVARAIRPLFSMFCSDPNRKRLGHPHAQVLRDFWQYGPLQVDKERFIQIPGVLL